MLSNYAIMKEVYDFYKAEADTGIHVAGETEDMMIFNRKPRRGEGSVLPVLAEKATGNLHICCILDAEDRHVVYTAKQIEVPYEFTV